MRQCTPGPPAMVGSEIGGSRLLAPIDPETGVVGVAVRGTGLDLEHLERHPDSGEAIAGFTMPDWEELVSLARRAVHAFPGMQMQTWDIALTDNGPCLIDVNGVGDFTLPQFAEGRGLLDEACLASLDRCRCRAVSAAPLGSGRSVAALVFEAQPLSFCRSPRMRRSHPSKRSRRSRMNGTSSDRTSRPSGSIQSPTKGRIESIPPRQSKRPRGIRSHGDWRAFQPSKLSSASRTLTGSKRRRRCSIRRHNVVCRRAQFNRT